MASARLSSRVDAGFLVICVVLSFIAMALPVEDREPIAGALRRTVVAPLVSLQRGAERWRTAWTASTRQQLIIDSLAMRSVKANALIVENDQLRKLLGLGTRLEWGFVPAEALHNTSPSEDLVTTLTLTAGSTAGVRKYSPVVSGEGLVGMVQTADPTMSIALLYTHPDFRASAMSSDGNAFGIVYPHSGGAGDNYMLELKGVPTRIELKPGTMIFTSGLGGTFPRGIAIGSVVQQLKTAEVWTHTYLLRPMVLPSRVNAVVVLTAQRVTQGTGNVWGAGAAINADSAARRIAAAGDSVAKQAALLQAQARQAALDSMKRATIDSVRRSLGAPVTPVDSAAQKAGQGGAQPAPAPGVQVPVRRDSIRPDATRPPRP
ncbi:MAG TPA: rod shape-determining protein MreC [Gemmatimonadaceae bacterium]